VLSPSLPPSAELYQPAEPAAGPRPLLVVLHGLGQTVESLRRWLPFELVAALESFVIVYPVAVDLRWSYGRPVIKPMPAVGTAPVDDIGFIQRLIDDLVAKRIADPKRVYVTGLSRGGLMSYTVACALADRVAAAAPLISPMTEYQREDCKPTRVMPILVVAGAADSSQPFNGVNWPMGRLPSVPAKMNFWRTLHGCHHKDTTPLVHRHENDPTSVVVVTWTECKSEAPVRLYLVRGGGHRIPLLDDSPEPASKAGLRNRDFDTAEVVWAFFKPRSL
jgi:polyhydroxybutyrate depolymerase